MTGENDTNYRVRLRAAALIHQDGKLLLVEHHHPEHGDSFWTLPGGGVQNNESLEECLKREVREEVNLEIVPDRPVYVMQYLEHTTNVHHVSFYFSVLGFEGTTAVDDPQAGEGYYLRQCAFLSQREITTRRAMPRVLLDRFWDDLSNGLNGATLLQPDADYLDR